MATFRCKRSGNLVSFTNENDIDGLRKHECYEEVLDECHTQSTPSFLQPVTPQPESKRRGRPKKTDA